ncbi:hypothetical protein [Paraburkholderia aspalathi]|uniref:hypothetical protein n=1 Tax=Paraburkholderia aspalathi TaxID=1324617 RepID=UPI0038BD133A
MTTIALVTEGITDQVFLERVLIGLYGKEIEVAYVQPAVDETDKNVQEGWGGWENVFEYFKNPSALEEIFYANEYVVIQIDTDCCEHKNFGVSYKCDGADRSIKELIEAVREKLIEKIGVDAFKKREEKIYFAISVHSLECWLLPLFGNKKADITRVANCADKLNMLLTIADHNYMKDAPTYIEICKGMLKRTNINLCAKKSESFGLFISSLPNTL